MFMRLILVHGDRWQDYLAQDREKDLALGWRRGGEVPVVPSSAIVFRVHATRKCARCAQALLPLAGRRRRLPLPVVSSRRDLPSLRRRAHDDGGTRRIVGTGTRRTARAEDEEALRRGKKNTKNNVNIDKWDINCQHQSQYESMSKMKSRLCTSHWKGINGQYETASTCICTSR